MSLPRTPVEEQICLSGNLKLGLTVEELSARGVVLSAEPVAVPTDCKLCRVCWCAALQRAMQHRVGCRRRGRTLAVSQRLVQPEGEGTHTHWAFYSHAACLSVDLSGGECAVGDGEQPTIAWEAFRRASGASMVTAHLLPGVDDAKKKCVLQ